MKTLLIISFLLLSGIKGFGQNNDEIVKDINIKYKTTQENLNSFDTIIVPIIGKSTEGSELMGFYDKDDLIFMTIVHYGERGKRSKEYLYANRKLCYVEDTYYSYNRPIYSDEKMAKENNDTISFDSKKTEINEHGRYYFKSEKLVEWKLINGRFADKKLAIFKNREIAIQIEAKELRGKLK